MEGRKDRWKEGRKEGVNEKRMDDEWMDENRMNDG